MKVTTASLIAINFFSSVFAFAPNSLSNILLGARSSNLSDTILLATAEECCDDDANDKPEKIRGVPQGFVPLATVVEALNPRYKCTEPVGEGDFILSRTGGPIIEELSNENLFKILMLENSDLETNTLVWKCLGYRFDEEAEEWTPKEVFPNWKKKFPEPPDFIGMSRMYSKEIDQPSLKSNQQLVKSIPADNKQQLKVQLRPLGFTGFKYKELTPNKTRRAQCANWLLYYREELFGYTIDELKKRRKLKLEAAEVDRLRILEDTGNDTNDDWKPPVKEVY